MSVLDQLSFGLSSRKVPTILQTEAAECGLACLAMVATFHGYRTDLATLRMQFPVSLKGTTAADLIRFAEKVQLSARAVKLDIEDLASLKRPCILHWSFAHFVVLKDVRRRAIVINDPAFGERKVSWRELSTHFTGVAIELWPNSGFQRANREQRVVLRQLMGRLTGLARSITQVLVLAVALEIFALVSPFFLQWVVDEAVVSADGDLLLTLALGFGLLMLLQAAIGAVRSWVLMHLGTMANVQWRANVFTHLLRLPVQYFHKRHLGDINSRFTSIDHIQNTLTSGFFEAILDGVMTIATLIMMFLYSPKLGWIAVVAMSLYAVSRWAWYGSLRSATGAQIVFAAKQQTHFIESVRGVRTIKLFQRESQRRNTWLGLLVDQINAGLRVQKLQIGYSSLNSVLTGLENVLVIYFGARMVIEGSFTVGALMAFKSYKDQFDGRLSALIDRVLQWKMLQLHGERLADIVLHSPEAANGTETRAADHSLPATIALSHVRFRYADHEPFVLTDVSFEIGEGESVAIVGPSGCGKTTLVNVMLGILQPTAGDVSIGGVNVKHIGAEALRSMVGTVMQDDVLFAGSIAENICFFDAHVDHDRIEECARLAAIHDDIVAMPMGYNSLVGDMGTVLSGGQKQRVLLARALYKRPKILFLDEATSHLDVERERQVSAAIRSLNITRVVVAHRPETIAAADRVIRLNGGRIEDARQQAVARTREGPGASHGGIPIAPLSLRAPGV